MARWLAMTTGPILVGPWRGEVGFEVLYWLPFLEYLRVRFGIPDDRLIPITRGGAGAWYRTQTGLELYALRTPQEVRIANRILHKQTGMLKQMAVTDWDTAVLHDAADQLKLGRHYHVLHPSWMFQLYQEFWDQSRGLEWLRQRSQFTQIAPPPVPDGLVLPERFLAVKFYGRYTYPDSQLTRDFTRETIRQISQRTPVVILSTGIHADDHMDLTRGLHMPNVQHLHDLMPMTPETNLSVLSAVLGKSDGFVGTYGGVSQLALRMGKGAISFYTEWAGTAWAHRHLSDVLAVAQRSTWQVQRIMDLALLQETCPKVNINPA